MNPTAYQLILNELLIVRRQMLSLEASYQETIFQVDPTFRKSAANLIHYLAFRSFEVRFIQDKLHDLGLSSLSSGEIHLLDQVNKVIQLLSHLSQTQVKPVQSIVKAFDYHQGRALLAKHTNKLFGTFEEEGRIRIMVTIPSEAALQPEITLGLMQNGMNVARINTAHDSPEDWQKMIQHIKQASNQTNRPVKIFMDLAGPKLRTKGINAASKKQGFALNKDDLLIIHKEEKHCKAPEFNKEGLLKKPATITTTLPQLIDDVLVDEVIYFDDGKFAGQVIEKKADWIKIRIKHAPIKKNTLKNDKGINLPQTQLNVPSLTEYDLSLLPFIVAHADLVGYSFVRTAQDVWALQKALEQHAKGNKIPHLLLKIEKKEAVQHLPELLLAGMRRPTFGVMIARGDLAVEIGFERLSEIQQEILWLCEAAHVPVVWATQVLESLAKEGLASRSEMSDAAEAAHAECVMLNKGEYIELALQTLDNVLRRMKNHISKKRYTLRSLSIAQHFVNKQDFFK